MKLVLPDLIINSFDNKLYKNKSSQKLVKSDKISIDSVKIQKGYTVVESDKTEYCLAIKPENVPEVYPYVIKVNKQATKIRLESGNVQLKKWFKHPLLKHYSTDDVLDSWNGKFAFLEESKDKKGLRQPQLAALHSILGHLKNSDDIATVVMPTGTGKTETMLATLVANKCSKLLVVVPSDALRKQLDKKFSELGLLKKLGLISPECLTPFVGVMRENFKSNDDLNAFIDSSNVIISTMQLLSNFSEKQLKILNQKMEYIFIDEAHHVEAHSWKKVTQSLTNCKILQFTATPFRKDQQRIKGKIIFNFSLRKAQEQGYFKKINFKPIREYDSEKADEKIADKAVGILRSDLQKGYDHFLMARCKDKKRAESIFLLYEKHQDLNPVLVHSAIAKKQEVLDRIVNGKHKIIVAVNMLGEGFDLPQLKIAAFHDIRKSLPITLQFAGRFTRTAMDNKLSNASFVANLADVATENELSELYSQDADWNALLSSASEKNVDEQIDFQKFISGFKNLNNSNIPFQNIKFALSSTVYQNLGTKFDLTQFEKGLKNYDDLEQKFYDLNKEANTLVLITAHKVCIDWVNYKEVYSLEWRLMVCYYDEKTKLLFIHSSDKGSYKNVANAILSKDNKQINKSDIFKGFHDISRISLKNVGLKEFLNHQIRFRMMVGTDIEDALSLAAKESAQRAFAFGNGYENGEKVTLGCSYKGRIWSYLQGDLKSFISWAENIARKLVDNTIDSNAVLDKCLIPKFIDKRPNCSPIRVDWHEKVFQSDLIIRSEEHDVAFHHLSIELMNTNDTGTLEFMIVTPSENISFEYELTSKKHDDKKVPDYSIVKKSISNSKIFFKSKEWGLDDFFNEYPVAIWFADGSFLQGCEYVELKQILQPYPADKLYTCDWNGVDISKESQGVRPLEESSIQYSVLQKLKLGDYDVIYDDDGSGEIADIVTIKETDKEIKVEFYHLKFAKSGAVNQRIDNFYEVCGQAQKSAHWKHETGANFFKHLMRRKIKKLAGNERSRIEKGTEGDLERLFKIAKNQKPMHFAIYIVQPSLSKSKTTEDIMRLLGVTDTYLKDVAGINLNVIVSP